MYTQSLMNNGLGYSASVEIAAFLGLKQPWCDKTYRKLEETVSDDFICFKNELLKENMILELSATPEVEVIDPKDSTKKIKVKHLILTFDMGWRQRNESNAGHAFFSELEQAK